MRARTAAPIVMAAESRMKALRVLSMEPPGGVVCGFLFIDNAPQEFVPGQVTERLEAARIAV